MARIRTIKPEFWEDEKIGSLPIPCRLLYIGLWNFADDQGVFRANPVMIKSKVFPYDENLRVSEVSKWLEALEKARMIVPIIHEGESYYAIRTFRSHQILDKRYMKFIVPQSIVNTALSHGEHIVNTTQEKEGEREEEYTPSNPPGDDTSPVLGDESKSEKVDYMALMDCFNMMFEGKLPKVTSMTDKRKKAVKARISEHGKKSIMTVFKNTLASSFLMGSNENDWQCGFDWIFRPNNFIKILEGNYLDHGKSDSTITKAGSGPSAKSAGNKAASREAVGQFARAVLEQYKSKDGD